MLKWTANNNALDAVPPIASFLKSMLIGGGPVNAAVTRPIKEDIDFNQQFDFLYRSLRQRLTSFNTIESCGHWNTLILDDLRTDVEFSRNAGELHESIVDLVFAVNRPTTDGLGILNAKIDFEKSICIDFQLWFFVERGGRLGHSASPSRFSVTRSADDENVYHASIGCGIRDSAGRFWYPREDSEYGRFDAAPDRDNGWAYFFHKTFGDGTLSNWLRTRESG